MPPTCCTLSSRFLMRPLVLTTFSPSGRSTATPAESYPRYSSLYSPCNKTGTASSRPTYPTIPHIRNFSSKIKINACGDVVTAVTRPFSLLRFMARRQCAGGIRRMVRSSPTSSTARRQSRRFVCCFCTFAASPPFHGLGLYRPISPEKKPGIWV